MTMNKRLSGYLRSLGLEANATDDAAWDFFRGLRGLQSSVANLLNHNENDTQARTTCDLGLRAFNVDPENPADFLADAPEQRGSVIPGLENAAGDGASVDGDLERRQSAQGTDSQRGVLEERTRIRSIGELADLVNMPIDHEIRSNAINEGVAIEVAQGQILDWHRSRNRPNVPADNNGQAPAGHVRSSQTGQTMDSLAACMMLRQGVDDPTLSWPNYNQNTGQFRMAPVGQNENRLRAIDAGDSLRGLSVRDICVRALALDGIRCDSTPGAIMNATRAAVSTNSLTGVFTQTFGALMIEGFLETEDTTSQWTVERNNPNFFQNERHTFGKMGGLTKHAKGGQADHMEVGDTTEYTRVNRYSGKWAIDEMDMINDTFGASATMTPQEMGAAARRLRPDLVYYLLLANPSLNASGRALFNSTDGNLHTSKELNKTNAEFVRAAMRKQIARAGVIIGPMPKFFLVPPSLN